MPDLVRVLRDGAVARELAGGDHVVEAFACETLRVARVVDGAELGIDIAVQIVEVEVIIGLAPISYEQAVKYLAEDADGFIHAPGSVAFVIETRDHAKERGAKILATVLAGSCASDNCGISKVAEDGSGLKHCINEGLKQAGIREPDLYVCGTPGVHYADDMEANVVRDLFDEKTALTAPQALVGTTLGASGGYGILSALYAFEKGEVCGMPDGDYEVGRGLGDRLLK